MKLAMGTAIVVLGMLAVAAGVAPAADEGAPAAALELEQATIDLGDVVAGSEAVAVFRFHNRSDAAVHIIRAKPS
jgi:hypothetical protein